MYEIQVENLPELVYRRVKDMILGGELQPGEKLPQESLAARLGVSRTPLLAVLRKLEKEMLVELVPRRGAFVRKNTVEDLLHIFDIRLRMEPLAARGAALGMNEENLSCVKKTHRLFSDAVKRNDRMGWRIADYEFHSAIMEQSGNPFISHMLSSINLVCISNVSGLLTDASVSLQGHEDVFNALARGNPDAAEEAMIQHLTRAREGLLSHRTPL